MPQEFDAVAFVDMWERCGNVVHIARRTDGRETVSIYYPDDAGNPSLDDLRFWHAEKLHDPQWKERVVAFLKTRRANGGGCADDDPSPPGDRLQ